MNIFQIDEAILDCVDMETGEIVDIERLEALQIARDIKIENAALWYKELIAEANAIGNEIKSLAARKKASENKAESLKKYLGTALDGEKFKTERVAIAYRKSESVKVTDISKISIGYLKYADPTVDKVAVKKALKSGIEVPGAELVTSNNIQVR